MFVSNQKDEETEGVLVKQKVGGMYLAAGGIARDSRSLKLFIMKIISLKLSN